MKSYYCFICHKHVLDVALGKLRKNTILICKVCMDVHYLQRKDNKVEMPDFLKDMFNM